jgi:GT2 family glycosyltransferase
VVYLDNPQRQHIETARSPALSEPPSAGSPPAGSVEPAAGPTTPRVQAPSVTVVVLNYNGWSDTIECVTSLLKISYSHYQIIVVDNGSTDESPAKLSGFLDSDHIPLLQTGKNRGIAGGNNFGIRHALEGNAELIVVLSSDTTVEPDFLTKLVEVAVSDERIGAVGAKILYYNDPKYIWFAGATINPWLTRAPHLGANQPDSTFSGPWEVDVLMGCVMLVKRAVFEQLGLFDERYFFQNEDLEFSCRVKRAGWQIKVCMESRIYHKVGRTITPASYDRWYYATKNRLLFIKENLSFSQRITSKMFFAATRPLKFIEWLFRGRPDLIAATLEGWRDYRRQRWGIRPSAR